MLKKNEIYPVEITDCTAEGLGVCRVDGQAVFVHGAIPGERAEIRIVKVLTKQAYGILHRLTEPSPHRVEPDCPYAAKCGGCAFRHMDYEMELAVKGKRIRDALTRLGGADPGEVTVLPAEKTAGYRNKALFPVGAPEGVAAAGFYRARSHVLIPVERCLLQAEHADLAKAAVVEWMRRWNVPPYDENTHTGLVRHVYVRSAFGTGQCMVCVVVNGEKLPRERELTAAIRQAVPACAGVILGENTRRGNAVLGERFRTIWGQGFVDDVLCGLTFRLSPRSFYQVNREQAQRLYALAAERAALGAADTVLDLYCGTGTITLTLAKKAGQAIGVEIIPAAVEDARENARRNGIRNARFFCADAGQAAQKLAQEGVHPQVVVVDPPRKGLSPEVIEAVDAMAPERLVYISCDPATLGRDVKRFGERGFRLCSADGVDLFPRCAHVETVVLLSKPCLEERKVEVTMNSKMRN